MEKINIAKLLEDCPKGMELYSPLCGKCVFDRLNMGTIICKKQNTQDITFTSEGYYMLPVFDNCECMIFPSKDQRDWSKFHRPFMDGDVVVNASNEDSNAFIYAGEGDDYYYSYVGLTTGTIPELSTDKSFAWVRKKSGIRLATEEEKKKLFDAIKANGYEWNSETRTLEKLVPNKFDITALIPFESRVLVRNDEYDKWFPVVWGFYDKDEEWPYNCSGFYYCQCIPYEGNEHLIGKTDDCENFYKTWE